MTQQQYLDVIKIQVLLEHLVINTLSDIQERTTGIAPTPEDTAHLIKSINDRANQIAVERGILDI